MPAAANQTLIRAERKKRLLLQGALYRLELTTAATELKQGLRMHPLATLARFGGLRVPDLQSVLPVLVHVLPLLAGKGTKSVWLRRVALIAGAGSLLWAAWRGKRLAVNHAVDSAEAADSAPIQTDRKLKASSMPSEPVRRA